jgi:hypothetical protein
MDFVVTEAGLHAATGGRLARLGSEECRERVQRLCGERGLPRLKRPESGGYSSPVCYASEFPGYFGETEGKKK